MAPLKIPMKRPAKVANSALVNVNIYGWEGRGVDEGSKAASWWSSYLGRPVRFVRFNPGQNAFFMNSVPFLLYPSTSQSTSSSALSCNNNWQSHRTALVDRQVAHAPDGYQTGFSNTGQFLFASEVLHFPVMLFLFIAMKKTSRFLLYAHQSNVAGERHSSTGTISHGAMNGLQASLEDLNARLPKAVLMNRFRAK